MLPAMTCVLPYIDSYTTRARMLITSSCRIALSPAGRVPDGQEPRTLISGTKVGSRGPGSAGRPGYAAIPPSAGRAGSPSPVTGARYEVRGAGTGGGGITFLPGR